MKETFKKLRFLLWISILISSSKIQNNQIKQEQNQEQEKKQQTIEILQFKNPINKEFEISSEQGIRNIILDSNGNVIAGKVYHNALDLAIPEKTPVYASKSGVVITVYPSFYNGKKWKGHPYYGGLIEIEHADFTRSIYAHLSFTNVKEGDEIEQGQEIGLSGGEKNKRGSGVSTGPHLHFEIILDIEKFIEQYPSKY